MNILIDGDGTVFDVRAKNEMVIRAIVFNDMGLGEYIDAILIGLPDPMLKPIREHIKDIYDRCAELGLEPECDYERARKAWRRLDEALDPYMPLLPNVDVSLVLLRAYCKATEGKLIVVTDKKMPALLPHLGKILEWQSFFDGFVTPDTSGCKRKPDPGMLSYTVEKFGLDLAVTTYVGDALQDYEACRAIGMRYFEVKTGWPGVDRSTYEAERFSDLMAIFRRLQEERRVV